MGAQHGRVFGVEKIAQRHRRRQLGIGGVHHQRLGPPDGRHIFQRAARTRPLTRRTIGQTRQIVVHRQFRFVERPKQAVRIPGADAVDGRFDDVDAARFQRNLGFTEHGVLIGKFLEVHLDAGRGLKGREHLFGQARITGPADKVQFTRRGQRLGRDQRRSGQRAGTGGRTLQKAAAGNLGSGLGHGSLPCWSGSPDGLRMRSCRPVVVRSLKLEADSPVTVPARHLS